MREQYLESNATYFDGLDPGSRRRSQIFAFKLLIIVPVSVALAMQRSFPPLGTLSFFCLWHSFFAGAATWFRDQRRGAAMLAAWDEMAAFLAIRVLMRVLDAIMV